MFSWTDDYFLKETLNFCFQILKVKGNPLSPVMIYIVHYKNGYFVSLFYLFLINIDFKSEMAFKSLLLIKDGGLM